MVGRLQPEKPGDPTYRQIWRVVDGAVLCALQAHPEFLAPKAKARTVRNSIVKRVTGAIHGYAEQSAWVRSGSSPADGSAAILPKDTAADEHRVTARLEAQVSDSCASAGGAAPDPSRSHDDTMDVFAERAWVTQTRGANRGRTGQVYAVFTGRKRFCTPPVYVVQFGASGPYGRLQHGSLAPADPEDVAHIMGCRVRDLPEGFVEGRRS